MKDFHMLFLSNIFFWKKSKSKINFCSFLLSFEFRGIIVKENAKKKKKNESMNDSIDVINPEVRDRK